MTEQQLREYALEHTDNLNEGDWQVIKLPSGIKALCTTIEPTTMGSLKYETDIWVKRHYNYNFWFQKYMYRYYLPEQRGFAKA